MSRRAPAFLTAALALLAFHPPAAAGVGPVGLAFVPIPGCRAVDTRGPAAPNGGPALGPNEVRTFVMTGTCGIPANALGLAVNLTVVNPAAIGFAVLYAGDAATPPTSDLAFIPGRTRAGFALTALASDGSGTVALANASSGPAHYLIDVLGYFIRACTSTITVTNPGTAAGTVNAPFSRRSPARAASARSRSRRRRRCRRGLTLAANGTLSGTPTQSGTFPIVVTATDANGCKGSGATYTLVISCQTITRDEPRRDDGHRQRLLHPDVHADGRLRDDDVLDRERASGRHDPRGERRPLGHAHAGGRLRHRRRGDRRERLHGRRRDVSPRHRLPDDRRDESRRDGRARPARRSARRSRRPGRSEPRRSRRRARSRRASISRANGVLSGTPTQTGVFPIVVKVTDGNLCTGTERDVHARDRLPDDRRLEPRRRDRHGGHAVQPDVHAGRRDRKRHVHDRERAPVGPHARRRTARSRARRPRPARSRSSSRSRTRTDARARARRTPS